ncbi:assimilatory sulfite reductase (NADPH) flavoprotein subunit [Alkalicoccobacillus murimartini]|uniref:Sulfite reductase (NADPH) flavoprotein alpha-component n=1 Tax=Alkalicoccobacillus murimartini TaxID=171685 RepID=A0ABT9YLT6_9BACI|nr:assimilatory sulfite reductase (NADPH) flavoprotein subunit [Alkalicoccobacillus murimartini]MDQ0208837.1 sulfite reductase (NADPH) flavoprotein alpha-component [Alkalicoccobacillus murimartini]
MQLHSQNSPFTKEQADLLNLLLPTLTTEQKIWISGYLAASQTEVSPSSNEGTEPTVHSAPSVDQKIKEVTILFGSQTGNGQNLAEEYAPKLENNGFQVKVSSMNDFKTKDLKNIQNLLIIVSTHGEGDPPDNALSFFEFLHGRKAPKLNDVNYSVLALGDTSYEFFCQTGKDIDHRLEELGGNRLYPRVDCDVDFSEDATEWIEGILSGLSETLEESPIGVPSSTVSPTSEGNQSSYSRTNPFKAEVLENINLNGRGSNKETRHLELSLEGSGLTFEPGDSLGIYPENDHLLVDLLIEETSWDPNASIQVNKQGDVQTLREALISHFEITVLTKPLLEKAAQLSSKDELKALLETGKEDELRSYLTGRDLLDLIRDHGPWKADEVEFTSILRKIPPRLYSIASSYQANPDEVHLTIGALRYDSYGRERKGVCSVQCAERLQPGDTVPIFIQRNQNFKLPTNEETPIIMVGPGTGVAPFRSFIEEREELDISGKSWLFFGEQHFVTDFFYQIEWQRWIEEGILTNLDVAFSRDQEQKIYVQHRMLEKSKELYEWLEAGAVVYVCGDETHMAHDVHSTLHSILQTEGGLSSDQAEAYLADLQQQKRYQRDVY